MFRIKIIKRSKCGRVSIKRHTENKKYEYFVVISNDFNTIAIAVTTYKRALILYTAILRLWKE